ncbi:leucine-rich repeat-containing protein 51-like [Tribolium madens]|uniref:leucine-rich repeat-containing protein 51-like n=1 Tax=Tribolium madens TaxID=41895 RepID=UPI001CF75829|nr:leucine-rich repeat-containing protein 51-like [Tribolium madens]
MSSPKMQIDEKRELETSKPADFSFKKLKLLEETGPEQARASRLGGVPERGTQHKKFLTRSVWLNNNRLKNIKNLDVFINSILEFPERLGWIDFSFNQLTEINDTILKFPDLKIVYFHGNCIDSLDQILKLKNLKMLKTITFHGNPISNLAYYRSYIIAALPQIDNLDFTPVLKNEKLAPKPAEFLKDIRATRGTKEVIKGDD